MIVAIMTTALSGTAWAETVTKAVTLSSGTYQTDHITWTLDDVITITQAKGTSSNAVNSSYISSPRFYQGHVISFAATSGVTITSIVISGPTGTGNNSISKFGTNTNEGWTINSTDGTATWSGSASSASITAGAQVRPTGITITYTTSGGSVTPTCATPTFSPAAGTYYGTQNVTISSTEGATIYYTTNGTDPTTSSSVYTSAISVSTTTTIKAYAVKADYDDSDVATATYTIKSPVSGYNIDFENDVDAYVDWEMTNIGIHTTGVSSAHGGSAWGSNVNAGDNATQTAIIKTKDKVAYPDKFTCYISKESSNTTSSSWKIQVSSDGTSWTDIATLSSMTQNTWTEFTGDIKAAGHTNVYVRLYYSGSNAKRAVDDISLTTYTPAAVEEPVISVTTPFTFSTTATITCVTEGATIYYSYDNSTWTEYTEGLSITSTTTIYAKAVKGSDESTVAQVTATKELATPTVEISATSFNIGETATVTTNGPAVTLTTSDATVASVSGTTVTGVAAGTATITATWSATADYSAGSEEFVVTVVDPNAPGSVNNPYTVAQALAVIDGLANGAKTDNEVYVAGTVTQIDEVSTQYHNATYWISNDGGTTKLEVYHGKYLNNANFTSSEQIKVNDQVVVYGKLQKYVKNSVVTPEIAADNYIYSLVREKLDPTINVSDASIAYGSTFIVSGIEGGDITVTSGNEAVATVEGLVITTVAVGTVTITVATAENATYKEGSETFELTVTAPVGGTEAPTGSAGGTIFEETFADCTGTNNDFGTSTSSDGGGNFTADPDNVWTTENAHGANGSAKFGASKNSGSATTPSITATVGTTYTLTFKAAPWGSESATMDVSVDGGTISGISEDAMSTGQWNDFTASITATATSFTVTFAASKNRFFLDEVKITAPASPAPAITATLNGNGYATFCSEYPLDFSEVTDFSAWQITDISSSNEITFEQVTGSVKGGTGLFLKGEAGATVTIPSADSSNELTGNLLVGTLAPSYFAANQIYGLAGNTFKKNSAGSIRANRAYIPADYITGGGSGVKPFTFIFEDDATGISLMEDGRSQMEDGAIYNVAGQRISKMQKGINIVNGKKIAVK